MAKARRRLSRKPDSEALADDVVEFSFVGSAETAWLSLNNQIDSVYPFLAQTCRGIIIDMRIAVVSSNCEENERIAIAYAGAFSEYI
jgi:hypothetical protein